jgi:serine/threonine protein kinase
MDHPDGLDLDRLVREHGPLRVPEAVDYLIRAARVLAVAHASGIVHGNISPGKLMVDSHGIVRVLGLELSGTAEANDSFGESAGLRSTQECARTASSCYMAPERAKISDQVDYRGDIYSLGCTLYYLLTGSEPFPAETDPRRVIEREPRALRVSLPNVPSALEAAYKKMVARQPEDRPASMTKVIVLLETSKGKTTIADEAADAASKPQPESKIGNEVSRQRPGVAGPQPEPSVFVRREEREGLLIKHDWSLVDVALDRRPRAPREPRKSHQAQTRFLKRIRLRSERTRTVLVAVGAIAFIIAVSVCALVSWRPAAVVNNPSSELIVIPDDGRDGQSVEISQRAPVAQSRRIFDGTTGHGWMLCNRTPLPRPNIQHDGLNPHSTGSYLVVYERKLGDFVLDFDYKLSEGCNSGVFLRVSDLNDPINSGIEVALDDTKWGDDRDSGALHGLVAPKVYAQKPTGQWNHMTITAQGSRLIVFLNDKGVSSIDLDVWTLPGMRPDGSIHQFKTRTIAQMARTGYVGFQDLGGNCWFKNITLRTGSGPR